VLETIADRLRRSGLPLVELSYVEQPTPAANTSYHVRQGRTVRAAWLDQPALGSVVAVNRALNPDPAADATYAYVRGLAPAAREDLILRFLCAAANADPALARSLGVPLNHKADPAGPQRT
jgi:hypothetical protein